MRIPEFTNGYPIIGIGEHAFESTWIASVKIPASITNISEAAFIDSVLLTNIVVVANNPKFTTVGGTLFNRSMTRLLQYPTGLAYLRSTNYIVPNSVTRIGASAFGTCLGLTSVKLPKKLTSIGKAAFSECRSLTNIIIPESVTNIDAYAFNLSGLTSITIPGSVANIATNSFGSCFNLANVNLTNGTTNISWGAFALCPISSIIIPSSVSYLGVDVFWSCPNLTNIYFLGNAPATDFYTFNAAEQAMAYYLPGTVGWDSTLAGIPTTIWLPSIQTIGNLEASSPMNFNINWASGQTVVIEACTNLSTPDWQPLQTNTLTSDSLYFSDVQSANFPSRYYRVSRQ